MPRSGAPGRGQTGLVALHQNLVGEGVLEPLRISHGLPNEHKFGTSSLCTADPWRDQILMNSPWRASVASSPLRQTMLPFTMSSSTPAACIAGAP